MPEAPLARVAAALADRYRIERELGRGGMATVYLAEDLRHHRPVAIKVLKPEFATALGPDRFLREIEVTAQLHHPNILPLYDSGRGSGAVGQREGGTETLFYVMPYVEGESLRDRLDRERQLPLEDALQIAKDVAEALSYAHSRGVIHRDIKPENILLESGHAVVADFGIAKAVTEAGGEKLTETGLSIGTPAYMSPEQAEPTQPVDARSDLYSLGCVLYEMLAGHAPFTGTTAHELLVRHAKDPVPPLRSARGTVPEPIEETIEQVLAKVPADRFTTAQQFVAALERARTAAPRKRGWRRAYVVVAVVAAAGLGSVGAYWFQMTGRPGTLIGDGAIERGARVLLADFVNRTDDSTLADAVREGMRALLTDPRLVRLLSPGAVQQALGRMGREPGTRLDEAVARELAEREGTTAFVTGEVSRLGTGYQFTARVVAAEDGRDLLVQRVTADDESAVIDAVDRLGARVRRGIGESLRGAAARPRLAQVSTPSLPALRAFSQGARIGLGFQAVALLEQAIALDSTFASAYSALAFALDGVSKQEEAQEASEKAYRYRDRLPEWERLLLEARYYSFRGEYQAQEATLRRMLELDPSRAGILVSLSDLRLRQRRFAEAESLAVRAIERGATWGAAHWNALEAQLAEGRHTAAESLLVGVPPEQRMRLEMVARMGMRDWDSAAAVAESRPDPHHAALIRTIRGHTSQDLGPLGTEFKWWPLQLLRYTGDTARALEALDVWRTQVGWDTRPPEIREYGIVIPMLAEAGRLQEARRLLEEWEALRDDPRRASDIGWSAGAIALAEGRFDSAATAFLAWHEAPIVERLHLFNRGLTEAATALDRAGHADTAVALFERALAIQTMDGVHYEGTWYPAVLRRLGELHESLGHRDEALDYYGRFVELWKDADAELQPQVEQVRERIRLLVAERG